MKIQLDYDTKTIALIGDVSLADSGTVIDYTGDTLRLGVYNIEIN